MQFHLFLCFPVQCPLLMDFGMYHTQNLSLVTYYIVIEVSTFAIDPYDWGRLLRCEEGTLHLQLLYALDQGFYFPPGFQASVTALIRVFC